ncbi:hypothetical protein [Azospirillum formosense]|nr:hypothetical protein [Azospirillum formosense]MBY3756816.1 hypothetical protein [Azospirillum formosense]
MALPLFTGTKELQPVVLSGIRMADVPIGLRALVACPACVMLDLMPAS